MFQRILFRQNDAILPEYLLPLLQRSGFHVAEEIYADGFFCIEVFVPDILDARLSWNDFERLDDEELAGLVSTRVKEKYASSIDIKAIAADPSAAGPYLARLIESLQLDCSGVLYDVGSDFEESFVPMDKLNIRMKSSSAGTSVPRGCSYAILLLLCALALLMCRKLI